MTDLRYPIGPYRFDPAVTEATRRDAIDAIAETPRNLRDAVQGLNDERLDTPYRPEGWTVRQVVHHLADSHINAYTRFRLALTEEEPVVRPYEEKGWAELDDARQAPVQVSLQLVEALHDRWVRLLRSLPAAAMDRTLRHPEHGLLTLDNLLQMYAWHGRHHVAHITRVRARNEW